MGLPFISDLVKGAADIVDSLHTSGEEKAEAHRKLSELQARMNEKLLDYESARLRESARNIRAEAHSDHWLAANWRPLIMLIFAGLMTAHWLGFTPENLTEDEVLGLMDIVKIALGGYVVGRSAEKIVPAVLATRKG